MCSRNREKGNERNFGFAFLLLTGVRFVNSLLQGCVICSHEISIIRLLQYYDSYSLYFFDGMGVLIFGRLCFSVIAVFVFVRKRRKKTGLELIFFWLNHNRGQTTNAGAIWSATVFVCAFRTSNRNHPGIPKRIYWHPFVRRSYLEPRDRIFNVNALGPILNSRLKTVIRPWDPGPFSSPLNGSARNRPGRNKIVVELTIFFSLFQHSKTGKFQLYCDGLRYIPTMFVGMCYANKDRRRRVP